MVGLSEYNNDPLGSITEGTSWPAEQLFKEYAT
jgi:hypothetical protein